MGRGRIKGERYRRDRRTDMAEGSEEREYIARHSMKSIMKSPIQSAAAAAESLGIYYPRILGNTFKSIIPVCSIAS
jgi:hypothetical protein